MWPVTQRAFMLPTKDVDGSPATHNLPLGRRWALADPEVSPFPTLARRRVKRHAGPPPPERHPAGADLAEDQCLGGQRLDEPPGPGGEPHLLQLGAPRPFPCHRQFLRRGCGPVMGGLPTYASRRWAPVPGLSVPGGKHRLTPAMRGHTSDSAHSVSNEDDPGRAARRVVRGAGWLAAPPDNRCRVITEWRLGAVVMLVSLARRRGDDRRRHRRLKRTAITECDR
jgi:hypothetical protein